MKRLLVMAIALCGGFSSALGAETWYYTGASKAVAAFADPSYWSNDGGPCPAISAEDDFIVRDDKTLWTTNVQAAGEYHFTGNSLSIGEVGGGSGGFEVRVYQSTAKAYVDNKGLFLCKGHFGIFSGYRNRSYPLYGNVTLCAPESAPLSIYANGYNTYPTYTNNVLDVFGPFSGAPGTAAILGGVGVVGGTNFTLRLRGSCADFQGTLTVTGKYARVGGLFDSALQIGTSDFAGRIVVAANGTVRTQSATSVCTVGSLEFQPDSWLEVPATAEANGCFNVTDSFQAEGPVHVLFPSTRLVYSNGGSRYTVLTVPSTAEIDEKDFVLDLTGAEPKFPSAAYRLAVREFEGGKALDVVLDPVVKLDVADYDSYSPGRDSAFDKDASWSDGHRPQRGIHYIDDKRGTLRTPECKEYTFLGDSMTVYSANMMVFTTALEMPLLRIVSGTLSSGSNVKTVSVAADRFEFAGETDTLVVQDKCQLDLIGPIYGSSLLRMPGNTSFGSYGRVRLAGDNSNFFGKMILTGGTKVESNPTNVFQTLVVSAENNLGGALGEMTFDALTLENYGVLEAEGSLEVSAANGRGIFVHDHGRFKVLEGVTLSLGTRLTVDGTATKMGPGTLALGGELRFGADGTATEPENGRNLLNVDEGVLAVTAADAVNGLAVTFAAGTSLALDPAAATGDLATCGIRNDKAAVPFAAESGTVDLVVGGAQAPDGELIGVGLFTVRNEVYDSVRGLIVPKRSSALKGWRLVNLRDRANDDGTTTRVGDLVRTGMLLLFR